MGGGHVFEASFMRKDSVDSPGWLPADEGLMEIIKELYI